MDKGLTPYLLVIAPVLMFIAFMMGPEEEVYGQEYIDDLKDVEQNAILMETLLMTVATILTIGSWFILTQDMMAKSNKTQRDLLMISRVALVIPLTILLLATGLVLDAHYLVTEGEDDYLSVDEENAIALNNHYISSYMWGTVPMSWGLGLVLIGAAGLVGNQKDEHSEQWVFAGPVVAGLGMMTVYWTSAWMFFMLAIVINLPIGVMMLMGKLDYLYSEEE